MIWGRISTPSKFHNEQTLPKLVYIFPNFFVLHSAEIFMKTRTKIPKLQMHEILQKNVNVHIFMQTFRRFYDGKLKQQTYMVQLYTVNSLYVFNPYKMADWLFQTILKVEMTFFPVHEKS